MRRGHVLFSAAHLFVVTVILMLGILFLCLQESSALRVAFEQLLESEGAAFARIGVTLIIVGVLLLLGLYKLNNHHYLTLKMGVSKTLIDEAVIKEYLTKYFKDIFPQEEVASDVAIHLPQKLEIIVQFPDMVEEKKIHLISRMENELGVLLARKLGYDKEFLLTISSA